MQPIGKDDQQAQAEIQLSGATFEQLRDALAHYSGVYLDQTSQRTLAKGLLQRIASLNMTLDNYIAYVNQPDGRRELQNLAEQILNHETVFFRNQPHVRALRNVILPSIHRRKPAGEPLRIWSAGCSTGEEPYSLAIVALETLGQNLPRPVKIWATDLSHGALTKAQTGWYRGRTLSNVSADMFKQYFTYHGSGWAVRQEVRSLIQFEQFNLLDRFPSKSRGVDIIFCQNVTIYFDLETFRDLVDRFYHILPEGGYLFLGFSETLWNIYDKFQLKEIAGAFVYVKEAPPPPQPQPRKVYQWTKEKPKEEKPAASTPPTTSASTFKRYETPKVLSYPTTQASETGSDVIQRGKDLLDKGQTEEALTMLYHAPLDGPHAPQTLALIAKAHANRGDLDVAVAEARRAIEMNSLTTEAYILLGVLYAQQGQVKVAAQQLERARYLEPDSALVSFYLAGVYREMNKPDRALREYRNTLRKLAVYAPDTLLDGVAVEWLRDTCDRYLNILEGTRR